MSYFYWPILCIWAFCVLVPSFATPAGAARTGRHKKDSVRREANKVFSQQLVNLVEKNLRGRESSNRDNYRDLFSRFAAKESEGEAESAVNLRELRRMLANRITLVFIEEKNSAELQSLIDSAKGRKKQKKLLPGEAESYLDVEVARHCRNSTILIEKHLKVLLLKHTSLVTRS